MKIAVLLRMENYKLITLIVLIVPVLNHRTTDERANFNVFEHLDKYWNDRIPIIGENPIIIICT